MNNYVLFFLMSIGVMISLVLQVIGIFVVEHILGPIAGLVTFMVCIPADVTIFMYLSER